MYVLLCKWALIAFPHLTNAGVKTGFDVGVACVSLKMNRYPIDCSRNPPQIGGERLDGGSGGERVIDRKNR